MLACAPLLSAPLLLLASVVGGASKGPSSASSSDDRATAPARTEDAPPTINRSRWHDLEIGANLGYMGGPCASPAIIRQAAADGVITRLRAMDPFPSGGGGTWTSASAPATGSGWMQEILAAHPATTLLVSLNNYPYRMPADFGADYQKYLPAVDFNAILAGMPPSFNYSEQLTDMARYTNRAPLFAAEGASLADYTSKLMQLRGNLSAAGLSKRVRYEIGNEPDALLYFWGSAVQFGEIADATHSALSSAGADPFYCCGYSSTGNGGRASRRRDCHFADTPSPSLSKRLLKGERGCNRMTVAPTAKAGLRSTGPRPRSRTASRWSGTAQRSSGTGRRSSPGICTSTSAGPAP